MSDASRINTPEVRALTAQLVDLQRRLERLERGQRSSQLGHSSIDGGTLWVRDGAGVNRVAIGRQVDGKFGWGAYNGDPPPRPNDPVLVSTTAGFNVQWNGLFAGIKPSDFTYVVVYASPAGETFALDDSLIVGRLFGAGVLPVTAINGVPVDPNLSYWVRFVAYNSSGVASEESFTAGPIQASPVVATEVLDGIVDTLALADDAVTAAKVAVGAIGTEHVSFTAQDLGSIVTYAQPAAPGTPIAAGSLWYDTDDGNRLYRWDGDSWEPATDADIAAALAAATQAQTDAATALDTAAAAEAKADGKVTTYFADTAPATPNLGDLWFDGDNGNKLSRWDGAAWVLVDDQEIADAVAAAATAQSTADGKIESFYQATEPAGVAVGDLWYDTDAGNRVSRWNGTAWTALPSGTDAIADEAITSSKVVAEAIQALHIAAEQIFASHIAAEQITGGHIQALAIVAGHIAANQIEAGHIQAGAITADKLESILLLASKIIAGDENEWRLELGDQTTPILFWNGEETGFAVSRDAATGQSNVYMSGRVEFGNGSQIEQDYLDLCEQPSTGFQTPKMRQGWNHSPAAAATSTTKGWGAATMKGTCLLAAVFAESASGSTFPAINTPSGWTLVRSQTNSNCRLSLFMLPNAPSSRTSETFSADRSSYWRLALFEWQGLASAPLDVTASDAGAGTTCSTGTTVTTTQANEMQMAVWASPAVTWFYPDTVTGGFNFQNQSTAHGDGYATAFKTVTATGTASSSITKEAAWSWVGLVATFKAAPAAPVPDAPPTSVVRMFTRRWGGKSTPYAIDDAGRSYPIARVPFCRVRLGAEFTTAERVDGNDPVDTWAQGDWAVSADPYGMAAVSGGPGTYSSITIPIDGWYRIEYRANHGTSTAAGPFVLVAFVARNSRSANSSVARATKSAYNATGSDGTEVQASRLVACTAGDVLYWGNWSNHPSRVFPNQPAANFGTPTEITVAYQFPLNI